MEAHAIQRTVRQSPRKMRLVVDLIRGKPVGEAFSILKFSKKGAAKQVSKVLLSAVSNARQKALAASERLDEDDLVAMGRGMPLKKRTSHVRILVATKEH
jgi:large subunit ribosomal protein L22